MKRHRHIILLQTAAATLVACLAQASSAEAGMIAVGSEQWEKLERIGEAVPATALPAPPAETLREYRPWQSAWSLGSAGASVPAVQTRRDESPQQDCDAAALDRLLIDRSRNSEELRLPPPRAGGLFRPPEDVSGFDEVTVV